MEVLAPQVRLVWEFFGLESLLWGICGVCESTFGECWTSASGERCSEGDWRRESGAEIAKLIFMHAMDGA